jgi:hypothetical protein
MLLKAVKAAMTLLLGLASSPWKISARNFLVDRQPLSGSLSLSNQRCFFASLSTQVSNAFAHFGGWRH